MDKDDPRTDDLGNNSPVLPTPYARHLYERYKSYIDAVGIEKSGNILSGARMAVELDRHFDEETKARILDDYRAVEKALFK